MALDNCRRSLTCNQCPNWNPNWGYCHLSNSFLACSANYRTGFGFTILGEDLQGIALNFWEDEIWASEGGSDDLFKHAEGIAFDTTAALIRYEIIVAENSYTLLANDNQILSGPLRDYTAFEPPPLLPINPYTIPNSLGLGDNTTSASAQVKLSFVGVTAVTPNNHTTFLPIITQSG